MPKAKNPATCRVKPGDRVTRDFGLVRTGTYIRKGTGYHPYVIRWDGSAFDDWYSRSEFSVDLTPVEPEPYEAWFVA